MDVERALVSKIIASGQLEVAVSRGLREDLFRDDECRDVWSWLLYHHRKYRTPPSLSAVKAEKPGFELLFIDDALDYLMDKFVVLAKRRLANEMVIELAHACDDPVRSENIDLEFLEVSRKLATLVPNTQVSRFKADMDKRINQYEREEEEGKPPGVPFGFPWLDKATGGLQSHEFCTVAGFSGLGKSSFLIAAAFNAFMADYTPLFISLEMEEKMLHRKWDAMAASLDYIKLKQLRLSSTDLDRWRETKERMQERAGDIPVIDSIRHCTPDNIFAEGVRYKPDVILVDYVSLMRSARPAARGGSLWNTVTEITQDLKQVARTLKIPIIAAAQTNRSGAKEGADLDNIGYSLSIVQDSDIVIGLHADADMKLERTMQILLRKNRDGPIGEFLARWDHEHMIFRDIDAAENFFRKRPELPAPQQEEFPRAPRKRPGLPVPA